MADEIELGGSVIPSYLMPMDNHNIANGKESIYSYNGDLSYDPYNEESNWGKMSLSVGARAVVSAFNAVTAPARWVGMMDDEVSTYDVLSKFDNNLAAYYDSERESIDIVGDVIGMFVPGMAGVKALNYLQKGARGLAYEGTGSQMLKGFGMLPDRTGDFAKLAVESAKNKGIYTAIDSNVMKAFGTAYAQNAMEFAAFETFAAATMSESPLFENHTATDIVKNSLYGGGLFGGAILGGITGIQTYGAISKARSAVDNIMNKARFAREVEAGMEDWTKLLNYKNELHAGNPYLTAGNEVQEVSQPFARAWEARSRQLNLDIQETFTRMSGGDKDLGASMANLFINAKPDDAFAAHAHLYEIGKLTDKLKAEGRISKHDEQLFLASATGGKVKFPAPIDDVVKYVTLWGDDAGKVGELSPVSLPYIADRMTAAEVERRVAKFQGAPDWTPVGKSIDEVETAYIAAFRRHPDSLDPATTMIGSNDLPLLERALDLNLEKVNVGGLSLDRAQLYRHIIQKKQELALEIQKIASVDPNMTSRHVARLLNVKDEIVNGTIRSTDEGYFAIQGFTKGDYNLLVTPSVAKVAYKGPEHLVGVEGDVISGMAQIKQLQLAQMDKIEKAVANALGTDVAYALKMDATEEMILKASTQGAGAGVVTFASGNYRTLASAVEDLGKKTNIVKTAQRQVIFDELNPVMYSVLANPMAGAEVAAIRAMVQGTGEKYVLRMDAATGETHVVWKPLAKHEDAVAAGKASTPPKPIEGVTPKFTIKQTETQSFLEQWIKSNDDSLTIEEKLRGAVGRGMGNFKGDLYFPSPSPKDTPFFSFVIPKNPFAGEKPQMIWARTADELAALEAKVPRTFSIIRKGESERFHKMMGDWDDHLGMHSIEANAELRRSGAAGAFHAKTNTQELMQELLNYRTKISDRQVRDSVEIMNSKEFAELRRMDKQFKDLYGSAKGIGDKKSSPFESYVKTALDIPASAKIPVWTEFNNMVETFATRAWNAITNSVHTVKSDNDIKMLNEALDRAGVRGYSDALTEAFASHPIDKKVASRFVLTANGALSSMMLRFDPMQALNNGVGANVLLWPNTREMIKAIEANGGADAIQAMMKAKVPGTENWSLSPIKLVSAAYADFFKYKVGSDAALTAKFDRFNKNGWMPSMMDQIRQVVDDATLRAVEDVGSMEGRISSMRKATAQFLEKGTGNRLAEEMNRFVAAHVADSITSMGVKTGVLRGQREADAWINTFVNRTQGNYLASQRPLMFQGPAGHAISLFQTYSFNLYQNLFRNIADGDKRTALTLMGLQSGIYGMNGLPGFNFMNETLVGNASGNRTHKDIHTAVKGAMGDTVGDWLLYGSLSNISNIGLYSRGDLNPRHLTILPTQAGDIPVVNATTNFFGQLFKTAGELGAGGDVVSTTLRGIEHAGISRPLAGLATVLQGAVNEDGLVVSTTGKNHVVASHDLWSMASLARLGGARPLDEAILRDAYHRVQVYSGAKQKQIQTMGSAIRDKVRNGSEITQEEYHDFLEGYVRAGGDQKNFQKFWLQQVTSAKDSQIDKMIRTSNSDFSKYLQTMMNGDTLNGFSQE